MVGLVVDDDLAQVEVLVKVHRVVADQPQGQVRMMQRDLSDQGFVGVVEGALPASVVHPAELSVHPHAKAGGVPNRVVLLAHVWPIQVAQLIGLVEVDQQRTISYRDVTGHENLLISEGWSRTELFE